MNDKQYLEIIFPKTDEEFDDWCQIRTFITKKRLRSELKYAGLSEEWYIIVRTGDDVGRWTAIFSKRHLDKYGNTSAMHVIDCGFKVI